MLTNPNQILALEHIKQEKLQDKHLLSAPSKKIARQLDQTMTIARGTVGAINEQPQSLSKWWKAIQIYVDDEIVSKGLFTESLICTNQLCVASINFIKKNKNQLPINYSLFNSIKFNDWVVYI
ncbi:hypothetical protein pb186bvf_015575 [Paramecium bursaria]